MPLSPGIRRVLWPQAPARLRNGSRGWGLAAAALVVPGAAFLVWWSEQRPHTSSQLKTTLLTTEPGFETTPALSPDGKQVAYSWAAPGEQPSIYVRAVDAGTALRLTSEAGANDSFPAWSPDGRYIAFCRALSGSAQILRVAASGGQPAKLADIGDCGGLSWAANGEFLAASDISGISLLSSDNGFRSKLTSPRPERDSDPKFSPDSKQLAFLRSDTGESDICVVPLSAEGRPLREPAKLFSGMVTDLDWTAASDRIVYATVEHGLYVVPARGGRAVPFGVNEIVRSVSLSRTGTRLVYERLLAITDIFRIPGPQSRDHDSAATPLITSAEIDEEPQYAPDGKRIAFTSWRSGHSEVWVAGADGRNPLQITFLNGPPAGSPRWSPDGRSIVFDSTEGRDIHAFIVSADGGSPRRVTTEAFSQTRPSWSRDGRFIYFGSDRSGNWNIWKAPASGGATVQVTRNGGEEAFESVDGRYLYWARNDAPGIWRMPVTGGLETQITRTTGEGLFAVAYPGVWFLEIGPSGIITVKVFDEATQGVTSFRELPKGTAIKSSATALSVSPDRRWVAYTAQPEFGSNLVLVTGFR